jgi:hypothetical protein
MAPSVEPRRDRILAAIALSYFALFLIVLAVSVYYHLSGFAGGVLVWLVILLYLACAILFWREVGSDTRLTVAGRAKWSSVVWSGPIGLLRYANHRIQRNLPPPEDQPFDEQETSANRKR